ARRPVKLAGSVRDRRHRGKVMFQELGTGGLPPFERLRHLRAKPPGGVLSAYLAVDTRRGEARDSGWRLRFRAAARDLVDHSTDRTEAQALVRLVHWVEQQLDSLTTADVRRGVALFATERPRHLELFTLSRPVDDRVVWADAADLGPLERVAEGYPTTGIVLIDDRSARLITTRLGEAVDEQSFLFDLDSSDWRRMEGPAPGVLRASGTTQADRYARRIQASESRWLRGLGPSIQAMSRDASWARVMLVSPPGFQLDVGDLGRWAGVPVRGHLRRGWAGRSASSIAEELVDELAAAAGDTTDVARPISR
ncbi:MAG: VLRF1 family aeRF1-type release factor, partial [Chloroflexota bacterium]